MLSKVAGEAVHIILEILAFIRRFGTQTAELDTIPATEVRRLVRAAIERHMDRRRWPF
jgi:hypothetical protein